MTQISNFILKPERIIYLKVIAVAVFWGGNYVFGKLASSSLSPSVYGFFRFLITSIALYIICYKRKEFRFVALKDMLYLILLAIFGCVLLNIAMQLGFKTISATRASLLATTTPLFVTIGAYIFFKERLNGLQLFGVFTSIIGTIFVVTNGNFSALLLSLSIGDIYIFISILLWVVYVLLGKFYTVKLSPLLMTTWVAILSACIFSPLAMYEYNHAVNNFDFNAILACLYSGLLGTCLAYVWFLDGVKEIGAAKTSVFMNLEPLSAIFLASIILGESISMFMAIGGLITILGVTLTNIENIKIYKFFTKK